MKITVLHLSDNAWKAEDGARFGVPIDKDDLIYLKASGLKDAAYRAASCMGWVWRQWLLGSTKSVIAERVGPFVNRGLEYRERSQSYHLLAHHDLYLLHCAIFGSDNAQLKAVANQIADTSGDKGERPLDNGELYAAAWCGMMKYWILGDMEKATEQSNLIWGAYREPGVSAASKPLVTPWLKKDWTAFKKAQQKDFEKLWNRARKDRWTIRSETPDEIVVTTERYQIQHQWCWAHCGMALLAHRQGIEVVTDPFWFPAAALEA
jgi:hypothetical protein